MQSAVLSISIEFTFLHEILLALPFSQKPSRESYAKITSSLITVPSFFVIWKLLWMVLSSFCSMSDPWRRLYKDFLCNIIDKGNVIYLVRHELDHSEIIYGEQFQIVLYYGGP